MTSTFRNSAAARISLVRSAGSKHPFVPRQSRPPRSSAGTAERLSNACRAGRQSIRRSTRSSVASAGRPSKNQNSRTAANTGFTHRWVRFAKFTSHRRVPLKFRCPILGLGSFRTFYFPPETQPTAGRGTCRHKTSVPSARMIQPGVRPPMLA